MKNYKALDVDSYIASMDESARPTLIALRTLILTTLPKAEEKIAWGIPFYNYFGPLVGYAAFKKHVTFGLAAQLTSEFREKLEKKGYTKGSKTIQIRFDQKFPVSEIKEFLKLRAKASEMKKMMKK